MHGAMHLVSRSLSKLTKIYQINAIHKCGINADYKFSSKVKTVFISVRNITLHHTLLYIQLMSTKLVKLEQY